MELKWLKYLNENFSWFSAAANRASSRVLEACHGDAW